MTDAPRPPFVSSVSPHFRAERTTAQIMWLVNVSLLPAAVGAVVFFGWSALVLMVAAVAAAVAAEALIQRLAKRPLTISDGSAVCTGILLAFNVPSHAPWWIAVVGSVFAIGVVKFAFGGLGQNIFNPALAARAFLLACYPVYMTSGWLPPAIPGGHAAAGLGGVDAISGATPLGIIHEWNLTGGAPPEIDLHVLFNMFYGNCGGVIGTTSVALLLIGAAALFMWRIITWHIPATYLATVFILYAIDTLMLGGPPLLPVFHLLTGGLILGAFFMATDYVTSPVTPLGRVLFGVGCGVFTVLIRAYGGYPEGVSYAILIMNAATPLIDRHTRPRRHGAPARRLAAGRGSAAS